MAELRTYSKEEVQVLLKEATSKGYTQGYLARKVGADRSVSHRKAFTNHLADKVLESADSILQ
jgi:hypothetical protein